MPGSSNPVSSSSPEQDQICHELAELTRQIDHLEMSEHDRLSRELQAVKMRIQEAERQRGLVSVTFHGGSYCLARDMFASCVGDAFDSILEFLDQWFKSDDLNQQFKLGFKVGLKICECVYNNRFVCAFVYVYTANDFFCLSVVHTYFVMPTESLNSRKILSFW